MNLLPNKSEKYYEVIACCLERGDCANKRLRKKSELGSHGRPFWE